MYFLPSIFEELRVDSRSSATIDPCWTYKSIDYNFVELGSRLRITDH